MVQAGVLLYKATGEEHFLKEAQRTAAACYDFFFEEFTPEGGEAFRILRKGNVWFSAVMVRGLIELYGVDGNATYVDAVRRSLDYAWNHARDEYGLFETDFTGCRPSVGEVAADAGGDGGDVCPHPPPRSDGRQVTDRNQENR